MVLLCRVAKTRTTFGHPERAEVTVVIDHIAGVGAFAETEVMATDPAAATALLGSDARTTARCHSRCSRHPHQPRNGASRRR